MLPFNVKIQNNFLKKKNWISLITKVDGKCIATSAFYEQEDTIT